jgi:hypothetical protein
VLAGARYRARNRKRRRDCSGGGFPKYRDSSNFTLRRSQKSSALHEIHDSASGAASQPPGHISIPQLRRRFSRELDKKERKLVRDDQRHKTGKRQAAPGTARVQAERICSFHECTRADFSRLSCSFSHERDLVAGFIGSCCVIATESICTFPKK